MNKLIREHNKTLLESERGTKVKMNMHAKFKVGVGFASEYRYAMHTLGFQYLYFRINQEPDMSCERFYYPEKKLLKFHQAGVSLLTQETNTPLNKLGLLLFSLNYEGNYIKLLEMFRLAKIPALAEDRDEKLPIVIGGGVCPTYNPEPIKGFFDAFVIGEAESVLPELLRLYRADRMCKYELLKKLSNLRGVYVPSYPKQVKKAEVLPLKGNHLGQIISPLTYHPSTLYIEIGRGCGNGCKFCMLGHTFRNPRVRHWKEVLDIAKAFRGHTNRVRLVTPSDSDHPDILKIYKGLRELGYSIKAGSQRADTLKEEMIALTDKSKLTIAPEAGSERLRKLIGKTITDAQINAALEFAANQQVKALQFFFIIGFPGETQKDRDAIIDMVKRAGALFNKKGTCTRIVVTINCHIKKPHTPFERTPQTKPDVYFKHINKIREALATLNQVEVFSMDREMLVLESVLVRGSDKEGELIWKMMEDNEKVSEENIVERLKNKYSHFFTYKGHELPWSFIDLRVS